MVNYIYIYIKGQNDTYIKDDLDTLKKFSTKTKRNDM